VTIDAALSVDGGHVQLDLYPGEHRERVADAPPGVPSFDPTSTTWVYYDGAALGRGKHEPVGIEIFDVADLMDDDLATFDRLAFPRVTVRGLDAADVGLVALLRRAREARREAQQEGRAGSGWPDARPAMVIETSR